MRQPAVLWLAAAPARGGEVGLDFPRRALNGSRPCSIPGECLRQGQRREPQLIGPSASSADGRKCAPWYSEELPGLQPKPFASFLLAFWRPVARDLALHGGCEQCDA